MITKKTSIPKKDITIKYSTGNKKISKDTIIINMTSAKNCPSAKCGLCPIAKKCYAKKPERMYPDCLPYRESQNKIWKATTGDRIGNEILSVNCRKLNKFNYLRMNESGDFENQDDVKKLSNIADKLASQNIKVYTYTHRKDLNFNNLSKNLTINSSWKDKKISNRFLSYPTKAINRIMRMKKDKKIIRCVGDCRKCHACKKPNGLTILCDIH